jgi:hypothetical protein
MELKERLACESIGIIRNDYQFDRSNAGYLGFLNTDSSDSNEYTDGFTELALNYEKYESILNASGLSFDGIPNSEEMIITLINK